MMESIRQAGRTLKHGLYRSVYRFYPSAPELMRPVFIIGCGRSGTTILGTMLAQHPQLAYLNEPRHIWLYEPRTDIWSEKARQNGGRLKITAADLTATAASRITRAFAVETRLQNAQRLVEKLPINSFRIDFISALFPDALFVHLIRSGIEVAHSIAKRAEFGRWFGSKGYKWQLLAEYARERGEAELVELCTDNVTKGMLEWRLSGATALEELNKLPKTRSLEIRYESLLRDPLSVCKALEKFIGVEPSVNMRDFAATQIARQSPSVNAQSLTPAMRQIGGDWLARLGYLAN
jgi:LPS sulfotransferase NodH